MASQPGPIKLLQMIPVADLFRTSPTLLVDQAGNRVDLEVLQPLLSSIKQQLSLKKVASSCCEAKPPSPRAVTWLVASAMCVTMTASGHKGRFS
ncbi:hypothetical protein WJX79_003629 [Trebouxia sp. C0005]